MKLETSHPGEPRSNLDGLMDSTQPKFTKNGLSGPQGSHGLVAKRETGKLTLAAPWLGQSPNRCGCGPMSRGSRKDGQKPNGFQLLMASEPKQTLLRAPSATTAAIAARLLALLLIGAISIWAHYEASRGFEIAVFNDVPGTASGRRFHLLFVSDDKATRIILNTSNFVERVLYPNGERGERRSLPGKRVDRVVLRLVQMKYYSSGGVDAVLVSPGEKAGEFVIGVDSAIMEEKNPVAAMVAAVQRGMARVWLWNGRDRGVPGSLLEGMVEYISSLAGSSPETGRLRGGVNDSGWCWTEDDPASVARFLRFCEAKRRGFVARLNRAMQEGDSWEPRMVDAALGVPARRLCSAYRSVVTSTRASVCNEGKQEIGVPQFLFQGLHCHWGTATE
ncbi:hypothetical protein H6P81_013650 [Aristolochia fimbriata]|uniref:Uncharacterized protein n=1 Tax=Aristolochia fimbriata TaxID=158543 RepID=A0AAV7EIW0_ARIFI|nr:hypothetical protein H6P81_013650 [Aristolochia fimbriata]